MTYKEIIIESQKVKRLFKNRSENNDKEVLQASQKQQLLKKINGFSLKGKRIKFKLYINKNKFK